MDDNFSIKNKRQNFRTGLLVVITVIYLLMGAVSFELLENDEAEKLRIHLNRKIDHFILKYNLTNETFERIYSLMVQNGPYKSPKHWNFYGSFLFATYVLTMIGYGHITPKTQFGKTFCIFYCFLGIPLSMIMFQSAGERINKIIEFILFWFKANLAKNKKVTNMEVMLTKFILIIILFFIGSYYFSITENWTYLDGLYYYCITLLTIGFGDFVPLKNYKEIDFKYFRAWFLTIFFVMCGLILFASFFNLLVLYIRNLNSEDNIKKRIRLKQKKKQMQQKMLIGDVISGVNKQDIVTQTDELTNLALFEEGSVCSCDDINFKCCTVFMNRIKRKHRSICRKHRLADKSKYKLNRKNRKIKFGVIRQPCENIVHLSDHLNKINYYNKDMDAIKRLAIESDFITNRIVERRISI